MEETTSFIQDSVFLGLLDPGGFHDLARTHVTLFVEKSFWQIQSRGQWNRTHFWVPYGWKHMKVYSTDLEFWDLLSRACLPLSLSLSFCLSFFLWFSGFFYSFSRVYSLQEDHPWKRGAGKECILHSLCWVPHKSKFLSECYEAR